MKNQIKKMLLLVTAIVALTVCLAFGVSAETSGDYEYYLESDGTVSITEYTGNAENVVIPSTLNGKKVTAIAGSAFRYRSSIKSVEIPDSVTSIGYRAFEFSNYIETIKIGSGVSEIEETAFGYCYSLKKIIVDENNKYFSSSSDGVLFNKDKTKLIQYNINSDRTSYTVPSSVVSIGEYAFMDADKLKTIIVPSSVTSIGGYTFFHCKELTKVTLSGALTEIEAYTFYNCPKLESVNIPTSVTKIGYEAFYACESLNNIVIPENVTEIGSSAFDFCESLKSINIPKGITTISSYDFSGCTGLEEINVAEENSTYASVNGVLYNKTKTEMIMFPEGSKITNLIVPEGVTKISYVSSNNLVSVSIPASVTEIESFSCKNLKEISVASNNSAYCVFEGVLLNKDKTRLVTYPSAKVESEYVVPNGIQEIATNAFNNCSNIKSVIVSDGVTTIEYNAFYECVNLKNIIIPKSVSKFSIRNFEYLYGTAFNSYKHSIENIYYKGSEKQWDTIKTDYSYSFDHDYFNINVHYNYAYDHFHSYNSKTIKSATCTATGKKSYTCSICGYSYTETIKKSAHKAVTDKAVAATYKKTGLTEGSHCSVCNQVIVKQETVKKLTLKKVTGLKVKAVKLATGTKTTITLSWTKTTGAEKYEVQQYVNKKWKTIKTTSKTSLTVKKLKANKSYKFRVRAIVDGAKGAYSKTLKAKTVPLKTTLTLKAGKKQLTAHWKTIANITGYEVTYSTSKKFTKKTTKTVTIKKAKTKKTTLKKLKSGKKYYVKVRAYKTVNGKRIYGTYSTVKTVKVK